MEHKDILLKLFDLMLQVYGPRKWWPANTRFEIIVGAILTQNVSWKNVKLAIANLKKAGLLNLEAIIAADRQTIAENIRSSRYYNQKAARLQDFCVFIKEKYEGSLDKMFDQDTQLLRAKLLSLRGIGKETADSILLYAGGKLTFVSDAYTKRFLDRYGLLDDNAGYDDIRDYFMTRLPQDVYIYNEYHALIDHHCYLVCKSKPNCGHCTIKYINNHIYCHAQFKDNK